MSFLRDSSGRFSGAAYCLTGLIYLIIGIVGLLVGIFTEDNTTAVTGVVVQFISIYLFLRCIYKLWAESLEVRRNTSSNCDDGLSVD